MVRLRQRCWHLYSTESSGGILKGQVLERDSRILRPNEKWRNQAECFEAADEELKIFLLVAPTKVGRNIPR